MSRLGLKDKKWKEKDIAKQGKGLLCQIRLPHSLMRKGMIK